MTRLSTKQIAFMSIFAALIAIITRLPGIPMLGGGKIELSIVLYPIIGIILGPWIGFLAAFIGNFIAWIIPTSTMFGLLLIPAGAIAAFVSGSLSQVAGQLNWKVAAGVLVVLDILWYLTPVGWEAPFFPILHLTALAFVLLFRERISEYLHSPLRDRTVVGAALCSFIAVMADHMFGSLVWIFSIGSVIPLKAVRDSIRALGMVWVKLGVSAPSGRIGDVFMLILPIMAAERIIYTAIATVLGVSIIRVVGWGRISTALNVPIPEPVEPSSE